MTDYQKFLNKLKSYKKAPNIKESNVLAAESMMSFNVSPTSIHTVNQIKKQILSNCFKGIFPFDMRIMHSDKLIYFKYLHLNFEKLDILYFQHDENNNLSICFFKFNGVEELESCVFEIFSTRSSTTGLLPMIGEQTESKLPKFNSVIINCYTNNYLTYYKNKKLIDATFKLSKRFFEKVLPSNKIFLLTYQSGMYKKQAFMIEKIEKDTLEFYPKKIADSGEKIIELINTKSKGIILFHGEKGCGKTTFIKYCVNNSKKEFYYITGSNASNFSSSNFLEYIAKTSKQAVFIFEDMEFLLMSRETKGNSLVSDILNASDGILSDVMSPLFIFTFNTNLKNIDSAFLRPGRLLFEQEFVKLTYEQAKKVADKNKIVLIEEKEYSLAEIFNLKDNDSEVNNRSKIFASENGHKLGFSISV